MSPGNSKRSGAGQSSSGWLRPGAGWKTTTGGKPASPLFFQ